MQPFDPYARDFSNLSARDLIDARSAYHVHLMAKKSVVATAIGRYLIRANDPDVDTPPNHDAAPLTPSQWRERSKRLGPRVLDDVAVRPWSWPCVLVMTREWLDPSSMDIFPSDLVPPFLYLPDGRVVPTCVVQTTIPDAQDGPPVAPRFTSSLIGGGYSVYTAVQKQEHFGSVGCLVSDGERTFALTNGHVTGPAPSDSTILNVRSVIDNKDVAIGRTAPKRVGKVPFSRAYPGWPDGEAMVNLDAGLIDVDDAAEWTSQIFGLGELGELVEFDRYTISTDWIGQNVRAFGSATGQMAGRILGLFYRYKTVGGFDYVSDFLIGPQSRGHDVSTRPGDSGTIWVLADDQTASSGKMARRFRPIAMQWGGHTVGVPGGQQTLSLALATSLSTICCELDVDIVQDRNTGHPQYWGPVGHYRVASAAIDLIRDASLKAYFAKFLDLITFSDADIEAKAFKAATLSKGFVPLADVPDKVWRVIKQNPALRTADGGNHFADMDEPARDADGAPLEGRPSLFDLYLAAKEHKDVGERLSPIEWMQHYIDLNDFFVAEGRKKAEAAAKDGTHTFQRPPWMNWGCLPFRVWQLFNEMRDALRDDDHDRFFGVAGVIAHYVGDASQPVHTSRWSHGDPDDPSPDFHTAYESNMLETNAAALNAGVKELIDGDKVAGLGGDTVEITSGATAAEAIMELALRSQSRFATAKKSGPEALYDIYMRTDGAKGRSAEFWNATKTPTIACIVDAADVLARTWEAAWVAGGSPRLRPPDQDKIETLYSDPHGEFAASMSFVRMIGKNFFEGFELPTKWQQLVADQERKEHAPEADVET